MDLVQEAPTTVILAEDEALLYLQATTMRVWAARGQTPTIAVHPGREKVNFYGTLNLLTGEAYLMRTQVMNPTTSAQHLQYLLDTLPDVPLLVLWDRAPWHRGPAIRELLLANPRLQLYAFPTASPDLNPQEHVWKATRHAVSHNHSQHNLAQLADCFEHHLQTHTFHSSFLHTYAFSYIRPIFN